MMIASWDARSQQSKTMAIIKGASSLTKILWTTANLLFEKGHSTEAVHKFMQTFVDIRTVRKWRRRYEEINGFPSESPQNAKRRIPLPPIDFQAIQITDLEAMADP